MAKELFIMFIYDTQRCQKEEDDPQDAVLYFHPTWVSDQQKLALCGQLMGATQFFLSAFSCPRVIALNSGKFVVQQFGQYILTVGTDRNIPDWILQHRANTLHNLVQFYHKDFHTIASVCAAEGSHFVEKLHQIFETYVPIIQSAGNIFGTIPTLRLPKSASSVFLEALQIIQCFQAKGILGGSVLYQNKVVATQLSSDLTKRLVSTDPYRIKSTAEHVATPFHLPVGVQLLYVYVPKAEYNTLSEATSKTLSAFQNIPYYKTNQKKVPVKAAPGKEQMQMKRDTSRIFTVLEEDGELDDSSVESKENIRKDLPVVEDVSDIPDISHSEIKETEKRPYDFSLPRSFSSIDIKPRSPLEDKNISKVLHAKVLSICCGSENDSKRDTTKQPNTKLKAVKPKAAKNKITETKSGNKLSLKPSNNDTCSSSLIDIHQCAKVTSKTVPMRCYGFGLPQLTREMCEEHSDEVVSEKHDKYFYNTIADPMHPCFRSDGLPISRSLFHEYLTDHYHLLKKEKDVDLSPLDNVSESTPSSIGKTDNPLESEDMKEDTSEKEEPQLQAGENKNGVDKEAVSLKQEVYRRSLSLPLKPLTSNVNSNGNYDGGGNDNDVSNGDYSQSSFYKVGVLDSPAIRERAFSNLQLTPLMSKLSILAIEERASNFYSQENTPCDHKDYSFPISSVENMSSRSSISRTEPKEVKCEITSFLPESEKIVLYVCGQQNMALMLLMEEKLSQDPEMIHSLWESSLNGLGQLEMHLRQCLEHFPQGDGMEPYSYLCLDPSWDMLQRGGSWGALELDVVSCLHYDFSQAPGLTEVVLRYEDSTVYGYQCGKTEVFYQQPVGSTPGLPTPADLMGTVPLKAKRRLERDHGIILL